MIESVWEQGADSAARVLRRAVMGFAVSPDDRLIAWWEPPQNGLQFVGCAEIDSGRELLRASGKPVGGLVWVSPDTLWVIRQDPQGFSVIAHCLPDGGVIHAVRHQALQNTRFRVERSQDGSTVMVAPTRWNGGDRKVVRTRPAVLLRGPLAELLGVIDIDRVEGFERRDGGCYGGVAALSPDGEHVAIGYNQTSPPVAHAQPGGVAVVKVTGSDSSRVPVSGASGGFWFEIKELRWINPQRVLLQTEWISVTAATVQDLRAATLERNLKGHSYAFGLWAWKSPVGIHSANISSDRHRLVLANAESLAEVDLERGENKPLFTHPGLFGVHWGSSDTDLVIGSLAKRQVSVSVVSPPSAPSLKGCVKLDAKAVSGLSLDRSPAGGYSVVCWQKLKSLDGALRVALVSLV